MIKAFAAPAPKAALKPHTYEPPPLGPYDVELAITHCGICHSDIHLIDDDWGISKYPLVPGHEVVGTVRAKGPAVNLPLGQRVGVGWQAGSCFECEWCIQGDETCCKRQVATCVDRPGGFADAIRVDSRFAFPLPDALSSENAGPLLCGGITVYTPIQQYARPTMRVGVIGIGGLGHLALQFAHAYGCDVTAFSTSPGKAEQARALGADHFVNVSDAGAMNAAAESLDVLMTTGVGRVDWPAWLNVLRPKGTLCVVGAAPGNVELPVMDLIVGKKKVVGTAIGGRATIREMLDFAARHRITAKTEVMPLAEVNTALDRVRRNQARYRMVLKM